MQATRYDCPVSIAPSVSVTSGSFRRVRGKFFRAIAPGRVADALHGSVQSGRYSRPGQRTLYLSASLEGVKAAMIAHGGSDHRRILEFWVDAESIFDLRDTAVLDLLTRLVGNPFNDWQHHVAAGEEAPSWRVRDQVQSLGAKGLIDPSRHAPGLWHLVLFEWNAPGAPAVRS